MYVVGTNGTGVVGTTGAGVGCAGISLLMHEVVVKISVVSQVE